MKKYLFVILTLLLTGCTNLENSEDDVPTMLTEYIETGLTINDNPIYFMRKTRSDIGVICSYEDVDLVGLHDDNLGTHVIPIYRDIVGGCNSFYYYYNDAEEGYETISSAFGMNLITAEDILSVDWGTPIFVTRVQFGDQWDIDSIKKEMANRDLTTLLSYGNQYCLTEACTENMNFSLSDFPGLEEELVIGYDFLINEGIILQRVNGNVWNVYLEPTGIGMFQFQLGYQVDTTQQVDHLTNLEEDED